VKKQKKDIRKFSVHPEKCTRCYLCQMFCSLKYQGVVDPSKAYTRIIGRDKAEKITLTRDCTLCGECVTACYYGARVFKERKKERKMEK
jgi:ferredoxin